MLILKGYTDNMYVAPYFRISLDKENIENQEYLFKQWLMANKHTVHPKEYKEIESGGVDETHRPVFEELLQAARDHQFDIIWVWNSDRITREGGTRLNTYLLMLSKLGIKVFSSMEGWLEADTAEGEVLGGIRAYGARKEREKIKERTRNSLTLIKKKIAENGQYTTRHGRVITYLGRPKFKIGKPGESKRELTDRDIKRVLDLYASGISLRSIAADYGCSMTPIRNIIKTRLK